MMKREQQAEKSQKFIEISEEMYQMLSMATNIPKCKRSTMLKFFLAQRGKAVHLLNVGTKKRERKEISNNTLHLEHLVR